MRLLALFIYILAELQPDGSAVITEQWDIDTSRGTEIYLTRNNLGDIEIKDFSVSGDGREFIFEGDWDVNRGLEEKAGRCGIVRTHNGYELCWGIGSYGHHSFTAAYTMTNAVKSLKDYDKLHLQLVSPGIEPSPDGVGIEISAPVALSDANARIWGFGFEGTSSFTEDGKVSFKSTAPFSRNSSAIALLRFDKGIFNSASTEDHDFDEDLERALEGASFSDDENKDSDNGLFPFLFFFATFFFIIFAGIHARKRNKEKILGCKEKDIKWYRDIPCNGDILSANYILERLGEGGRDTIASAMILRMINNGIILVSGDGHGRIEMSFNPSADPGMLSDSERGLYDMMKEASGKDLILQHNEFRRWSSRHTARISQWAGSLEAEGKGRMAARRQIDNRSFLKSGQESARDLIGFRNYLKDFTLVKERQSVEVGIWHDLLVFAALFGIAEKVAEELKEINPEAFEETFIGGPDITLRTIRMTQSMASSITNARAVHTSGASRGGFGGVTSFGGGGGFHGGGFGGGVR